MSSNLNTTDCVLKKNVQSEIDFSAGLLQLSLVQLRCHPAGCLCLVWITFYHLCHFIFTFYIFTPNIPPGLGKNPFSLFMKWHQSIWIYTSQIKEKMALLCYGRARDWLLHLPILRQWCCEPLKNVKAIARVAEIVELPPRLTSFRIISYKSIGSTKKISAKECIFGEKHYF